jgi:hypothetical protein
MEDISLLRKLERVTAPSDFEQRVLTHLARKRASAARARRVQVFRYSLAGAAAALLVCFLVLNVFVLRTGGPADSAGPLAQDDQNRSGVLPVMETVDYGREVRSASYGPRAVYILENVSYASNPQIKY